ncbi:MAG: zinc transport system substrate-binding protein [Cognaticolwellia sp.]|jgi:zinc transport system substrate-binding protein
MLFSLLFACTSPEPSPVATPPQQRKPTVVVSAHSSAYLVQRLAQDSVELVNLLPEGADPVRFTPSGDQVALAQAADLVLLNGAGLEGWVQTASLNQAKVVDTALGIELIELQGQVHSHGKDGDHSHGDIDPHTWSDPLAYLSQARATHAALKDLPGLNAADLDAAMRALDSQLVELDGQYKVALEPWVGTPLAASHPAFNYVARQYGLDLTPFDFDPGQAPADLRGFEQWAKGQSRPVLWWESQPSEPTLAAFPAATVHLVLSPLEQPEGGRYDYFAQAQANLAVLGAVRPGE